MIVLVIHYPDDEPTVFGPFDTDKGARVARDIIIKDDGIDPDNIAVVEIQKWNVASHIQRDIAEGRL